jgi:hypothetical protein
MAIFQHHMVNPPMKGGKSLTYVKRKFVRKLGLYSVIFELCSDTACIIGYGAIRYVGLRLHALHCHSVMISDYFLNNMLFRTISKLSIAVIVM